MRKHDLMGRLVGVLVFLCGICILGFIFWLAYSFFHAPLGHLPTAAAKGSTVPASAQLGNSALLLLGRIGLLIVMTIIGSIIASRGVQLYFAAAHHATHRQPIEPIEPTENG